MRIDIQLSDGAFLPSNAHPTDTGYDLTALSGPQFVGDSVMVSGERLWRSISYIEYDTGISVAPPTGGSIITQLSANAACVTQGNGRIGYLLVYPRSSLSKTNLLLANSVAIIDNAYRGTIKLRFRYIIQPSDLRVSVGGASTTGFTHTSVAARIDDTRIYQRGDKIGQAVAAWKEDIQWQVVESLDNTVRGAGGFGSTS